MQSHKSGNFSFHFPTGLCIVCLLVLLSCGRNPSGVVEQTEVPVANTGHLNEITNPLIEEPGMADPHMLVVGDTCYVFTGHDVGFGVSDWVMPDYRIYRSTDLKSWAHVGTIKPEDTYMGAGHTDCWAGDVATRNGKYYWYFSNRKESAGVMVADRPEGPYKDALGVPLVDSFDPTIFTDDDGTPYIIYGEGTYKIARLKESMIELDEEPKEIKITGDELYECCGDKNSVHKYKDTYYISYSGFYATSKSVYGPYHTRGVVAQGYGVDTQYGHGDWFVWKGDWYHTWCRYKNRSYDRIRDCFIAPTYYDEDGNMHDDLSGIDEKYSSTGIYGPDKE